MLLLALHPVHFILYGIVASTLVSASSGILANVTLFFLCIFTTLHAFFIRHNKRSFLLLLVTSAVGITNFRYQYLSHRFEAVQTCITAAPLSFAARVASIEKYTSIRTKYKIILDSILLNAQPSSTLPPLIIYAYQKADCAVGDILLVKDLSIEPVKKESIRRYFIKENMSGSAFVSKLNYTLVHQKNNTNHFDLGFFKETLSKNICLKMNKITSYFFKTIFLGKKLTDKQHHTLQKQFAHLGICHLLARSGLHVTSITSLWLMLLRIIPIFLSIKQTILSLLLLIFYAITWGSIPFARALLGAMLLLGCTLYKRPAHHWHLMLLNTSCMLAYNPHYLFALDFQLSYSLAITIAIYNHLKKIVPKLFHFLINNRYK